MTELELLKYLKSNFPKEIKVCEWKQFSGLKHNVSANQGDDIISYVSAIANMRGGHLVIGVTDGIQSISGISDLHNYTPENFPHRLTGN